MPVTRWIAAIHPRLAVVLHDLVMVWLAWYLSNLARFSFELDAPSVALSKWPVAGDSRPSRAAGKRVCNAESACSTITAGRLASAISEGSAAIYAAAAKPRAAVSHAAVPNFPPTASASRICARRRVC